jgi:hypothetical protein
MEPKPELRTIAPESIPRALEKALRYRLLEEADQAESICLDVLAVEPGNEKAMVTLILALSDQLDHQPAKLYGRGQEWVAKLSTEYARAYYGALLCERRANAHRKQRGPGSANIAYEWYQKALAGYARAIELRPPGNDDAILRWNACVRILAADLTLKPAPIDTFTPMLE